MAAFKFDVAWMYVIFRVSKEWFELFDETQVIQVTDISSSFYLRISRILGGFHFPQIFLPRFQVYTET